MRKVIYGTNVTIDGVCDHTRFSGGAEILDYFTRLMGDVDLIVYGRKTYELMMPYWPDVLTDETATKEEHDYAAAFSAIDKLMFSRTLTSTENRNTRIVNTSPVDELLKLKQQPGKSISVGGVELPAQLVQAGLVDEFHIIVHPLIAGKGRRLFEDMELPANQHLQLAETMVLPSGCVALRYVKG